VAVAIFRSLEDESLEDVSIRLAQQWRIGRKGLDNGVILLAFLDDRRVRLEVGYGLESRLTDALAGTIIRNEIAPRFREQRYADGIEAGLDAIYRAIAGEYRARPPSPRDDGLSGLALLAILGVIVAIAGFTLMSGMTRRGLSRGRGGYTVGPGGWYHGGGGFGSGGGGFSGSGGGFGGGGSSGSW
jgi:uncharacterized protein